MISAFLLACFSIGPVQYEVVTSDGIPVVGGQIYEKIHGPCPPWDVMGFCYNGGGLPGRLGLTDVSGTVSFPKLQATTYRDKETVHYQVGFAGIPIPGCPERIKAFPSQPDECMVYGELLPDDKPFPVRITCRVGWTDREVHAEVERLRALCAQDP